MKNIFVLFSFFCVTLPMTNFLLAAEIKLREQSYVSDTLVRLGDVADIISNSPQESTQLKQTILFPTPQSNNSRTISLTEIRDLLARLGINVLNHNFTGEKKITIINPNVNQKNSDNKIIQTNLITTTTTTTPNSTPATSTALNQSSSQSNFPLRNISPDFIKQMEKIIGESIHIYLRQRLSDNVPSNYYQQQPAWNVSVKLTREQTLALATNGQINEIEGGSEPLVGKQKFQIKLQNIDPKTNQNIAVTVEAYLIPVIKGVVAIRKLPKGYIIGEDDVKISECEIPNTNNSNKLDNYFNSTDNVIGKEVTDNIKEGNIITQSQIKRPTWVRKGDAVTIVAKNSGVVVRTIGIAKSDGGEGDTIFVTRIEQNNQTSKRHNPKQPPIELVATVTHPKVVEVNATPIEIK